LPQEIFNPLSRSLPACVMSKLRQ